MKKLCIILGIVVLSGCAELPLDNFMNVPFLEGETTVNDEEMNPSNDCSNLPPWKQNKDGTCI